MMKISALVLLLATVACSEVIIEKVSVAVLPGEEAVIPCKYTTTLETNPLMIWGSVIDGQPIKKLYSYKKGGDTDSNFKYDGANMADFDIKEEDGSLIIRGATLKNNLDLNTIRCSLEFGKEAAVQQDMSFVVVKLQSADPVFNLVSYGVGKTAFDISPEHSVNIGKCQGDFTSPQSSIMFYKRSVEDGKVIEKAMTDGSDDFFSLLDPTIYNDGPNATFSTEKDFNRRLIASDHQAEFICSVVLKYNDKTNVRNVTLEKFNVNHQTTEAELMASVQYAYAGEEITLSCSANGYPEPTISIDGGGSSKTFVAEKNLDGTVYECSATQDGQDPVTTQYTLEVLSMEEPTIADPGKVVRGQNLLVQCSAEGTPAPSVAWYKDGAKYTQNGDLSFDSVSFGESGIYTCQASNGHEALKRVSDYTLTVEGITLVGDEEELVTGKKDDVVLLECKVESNPRAVITWDVPNSEETPTVEIEYSYSSEVKVGPLVPELSEVTYTCTATNSNGDKVTKAFKLPLIEEPASATAGIIIAILVIILIVAIILAVLYNKGIICKKGEKGEESAEGDIAVEINNENADVEAGNAKPAEEPVHASEEEKLMNGQDGNE